ncbi:hypothetical protein Tco_0853704 [Tanacetum coccineum]
MCVVPDAYTYPPLPRVPLSYQESACSLSTVHFLKFPENRFELLKLLKNSVEVLKIQENKLESMRILENKLESLKLQENQPVDRLTQFDMRPHMESDRWPLIYAAIQQHLQKIYNGKKAALKEKQ